MAEKREAKFVSKEKQLEKLRRRLEKQYARDTNANLWWSNPRP